jgi:hypothetical protein
MVVRREPPQPVVLTVSLVKVSNKRHTVTYIMSQFTLQYAGSKFHVDSVIHLNTMNGRQYMEQLSSYTSHT